jgi:broad specificity phosphatase PhoE
VTKDVRVVYSSDLRRTRCTAEIIAERLACPVRTDARLRERDFGQLEGSPAGALRPEVTGRDRGRVADLAAHPPGGESLDDLAARCADFAGWLEARPNDGDAVTVAHGGSIRLLRAALCGTEPSGMTWGSVANASVHRLVLRSPTPLTSLSLVPTVHTASTRDRPLEETVRSDPFGTDDPPRTHRMVGRPSTPPSELIE